MPRRNIELMSKIRDLLILEPNKHDQDSWASIPADLVKFNDGGTAKVSCGTAGCVAGWATYFAGDKYLVDGHSEYDEDTGIYYPTIVVAKNNKAIRLEARARDLLGLSYDEADYLFDSEPSTAETIVTLTRLIAGEQIVDTDGEFIEPKVLVTV